VNLHAGFDEGRGLPFDGKSEQLTAATNRDLVRDLPGTTGTELRKGALEQARAIGELDPYWPYKPAIRTRRTTEIRGDWGSHFG
jgi:hypothetical protein